MVECVDGPKEPLASVFELLPPRTGASGGVVAQLLEQPHDHANRPPGLLLSVAEEEVYALPVDQTRRGQGRMALLTVKTNRVRSSRSMLLRCVLTRAAA